MSTSPRARAVLLAFVRIVAVGLIIDLVAGLLLGLLVLAAIR